MNNLRTTVLIVALLNFAYFFVEFFMAVRIGSVSLFADSVDFLEDTAINLLVFFAVVWSVQRRRLAGSILALFILAPALAALITAVVKMINQETPEPSRLTIVALGALLVNLVCALLLAKHRNESGSLARGAWLAARNDALANILMIGAGLATFAVASPWWDIAVGLLISLINFTAFREVWEAARFEGDPMELLDDDD